MKHLNYRSDIDGLRAIAVLSVLIYHMDSSFLPGGFVGVDIFFVISGFLITGIIRKSLVAGDFSFSEFYIRRIRRILPATTFVILVTLVAGTSFLLPEDIQRLAYSSVAALFSAANIFYWKFLDTGYFATSSELVPLLHMWSLGVEEQFYLIWPFLLVVASVLSRKIVFVVAVVLSILCFSFSQMMLSVDPLFAYYMLPSRAGALILGALVFIVVEGKRDQAGSFFHQLSSYVGLLLLIGSLVFIQSGKNFPGLLAVIPALGAALIIWSGCFQQTYVYKILSNGIFVKIGLYSFSLYLWHWPVLALHRYAYGEPEGFSLLICLGIIVLGTVISYNMIEEPFRRGFRWKALAWKPLLSSGVGLLLAISVLAHYQEGKIGLVALNGNFEEMQRLNEITKPAPQFNYVCQSPAVDETLLKNPRCVLGGDLSDKEPNILVFGDSNASHYMGYIKTIAEDLNLKVRNVAQSSCVPLIENSSRYVNVRRESCANFNSMIKNEFSKYEMVVIGAAWTSYRGAGFHEDVRRTIEYLSDEVTDVVIALKIPGIKGYDRQCLQKALFVPGLECFSRGQSEMKEDYEINRYLESLAEEFENVTTLTVRDYLCKENLCSSYLDGIPVYFNASHLSLYGSELIGARAVRDGRVNPIFKKYALSLN